MYLAIDVGGTKTLLATFDEQTGKPVKEVQFPTAKTYHSFLDDIESHLPVLGVFTFKAAGAGIPGRINRETGGGIDFGNLPWKNVAFEEDLERILECPVFVENDAKVAGLSEAILIKNDFKSVLYVTLGTGLGLAYINDGVMETTFGDRGGKDIMVSVGGQEVEWESIASGSAIKEQFGKIASDITDEASWQTIAQNICLGLTPLIKEKKPDAVVFGGGAGKHFERYGELVKQELTKKLEEVPAILPAQHAEEAVIYGCIELIKQNHGTAT